MLDLFSSYFLVSKAIPKILLGIAKPKIMVLLSLVGLFFKNVRCPKLPAHRLISNNLIFLYVKTNLNVWRVKSDTYEVFKKWVRPPKRIGDPKRGENGILYVKLVYIHNK
jgi:hypothetical protein